MSILSTAEENLVVKRLGVAQVLVGVRAACRLVEFRCPGLFTNGTRFAQASRECDDLCMVTADLLLSKSPTTKAPGGGYARGWLCMLKCEACAREAERLSDPRLQDLVNACREAAIACRDLAL